MSSNESREMYLETVYLLEESEGHAHGVDIANKLGVSKASVTKAMKHLKEDGYIRKESYGSITLTDRGREVAQKVYKNHKLITEFLMKSLGVNNKIATDNACKMEHILSDELLDAIEGYLKETA